MTDEQAHRRARAAIEAAHARDDAAANAEAARDARELQALADGGRPRAEPPQWKDPTDPANYPPRTHRHHHLPAIVRVSPSGIRRDLAAVDGFNAKAAIVLTSVVGTMWCFWAFNGIALVSLPSAIRTGNLTILINWVSSNWIQLILLPALLVGQRLQAAASDARAAKEFEDTERILDQLDLKTAGGMGDLRAELLDAIHALNVGRMP